MFVASVFAYCAFRAIRHAPLLAGPLYYVSASTALAASFAMLVLAGSGLRSRQASCRRLFKAATWAACSGLVLMNSAGIAALAGEAQEWSYGSIAFCVVMAAVFVAGEVRGWEGLV